jgi:hypothetical protein
MLSQRTVGKVQYLLEQMFQPLNYGSSAGLTLATYARLLYETDVPSELLDFITAEYRWHPGVFVRALHEGQVTARLRYDNGVVSDYTPTNADRDAGDKYLLKFATVALQQWAELCSENYFRMGEAYTDTALELIRTFEADGFQWKRDVGIFPLYGQPTSQPLSREPQIKAPAEKQVAPASVSITPSKLDESEAEPDSARPWSRGEKLTLLAVVLAVFGLIANWLVVPEVRKRLKLDTTPAVQQQEATPKQVPDKQHP